MSDPRDPLRIPLQGLHLIEASAGTGKTYAIAHLVLRLVVEAGLDLERVLVLTFTEAAAEELRGRITRRLRQALDALDGTPTEDPVLLDWVGSLPDPDLARARLEAALAGLDRAAIRTIHGFCQRVLRDFAFESGTPFDTELITDEQDLRQAIAEDFWRRRMGGADRSEAAWLIQVFPEGPQSLLARLNPHLGPGDPMVVDVDRRRLAAGLDALARLHDRLRSTWPAVKTEVSALLLDNPSLSLTSYKPGLVMEALVGMDILCAGPVPFELPPRFPLFTPAKLKGATKKGGTTPTHPFLDLCGELATLDLEGLARARWAALLGDALGFLRAELARRKRERRVTYFDDLLSDTAQALTGPRGPALAARVRDRYPQALIDEFQDTDRLQYQILDAVYGEQLGKDSSLGLYLIGDPKQAIYGFRGADVFAYMAVRRDAQRRGQIHTLDTNRRSSAGLVEAINQLFGRVRAPFIFEGDIDFSRVRPGPNADAASLRIGGKEVTPLSIRWIPPEAGATTRDGRWLLKDSARALAVADCASQITALLAAPARLGDRDLRAADIAVLVRSHRDGLAVREALTRAGVGSVSIGQETVLETEEAEELAALIAALRPGARDGVLRAALATRLLGWSAGELAALDRGGGDTAAWDQTLQRFHGYRRLWQERGFMAALAALIHGLGVPERLLRGPNGERRLTNLLHLMELAQAAAREHPGPEALGRWLAERRMHPEVAGDAALLRLESDENLVQIVTFHKSKGLEYPVVLIPIPWSSGPKPDHGAPVAFHDPESLEARLDLGSPELERHRDLWEREDLAERLRLLYVALTRAQHQCILHWGPVNGAQASAAAYLLHQGCSEGPEAALADERMSGLDAAALRADLEALARAAPGCIAVSDLALGLGPSTAPARDATAADLRPAHFPGTIPDDWHILSFSALAAGRGEGPGRPDHDALDAEADLVPAPEPTARETAIAADGEPWETPWVIEPIFRFPRGVRTGHCLHDLFEHLDFTSADGPDLVREVRAALARHGIEDHWTPTLVELVARVLDSPLTPEGLRLRGLRAEDRRNELEFQFALQDLEPGALARALRRHGVPAEVQLPDGSGGRLAGLMRGFIDLVARREGRFYVIDYKSNHLGDRPEDYDRASLERAMTAHHYHLQSLIYTLALHRYLRSRLDGYDYDRHQGGSLYLFLRGMRPGLGTGWGVYPSRPSRALIDELDQLLGGAQSGLDHGP